MYQSDPDAEKFDLNQLLQKMKINRNICARHFWRHDMAFEISF